VSQSDFRWNIRIDIQITGTEIKKDAIKNAILTQLVDAFNAGNIDKAEWSVTQNAVPESGVIK